LFAVTEELRAAGELGRSAQWLADRFEVSTRTIKRDVLALLEAGIPIWSDTGPGGGYRFTAEAKTVRHTVEFTDGEAAALAVALAQGGDSPFAPEARSALAKLLRTMPSPTQSTAGALAGRVWIRGAPTRTRAARVLDDAMRRRRVVHIDYRDGQGGMSSKRPVEPLAYGQSDGHWYLLAWCQWREAGRWFRLDRVENAYVTHEAVVERNLAEVFGTPPDDVVRVVLE
jgi:predicted DNA-binding transcriptional regulator YafY